EIVEALRHIVPGEGVIASEAERRAYESDGLTAYRQLPMVVVLPSRVEEVAAVLRYCKKMGIKVVPRGAGTSLSGGAMPLADGVLLGMAKFNRILDIDYDNRCVVAQPGVTNLAITRAVEDAGFYYAPDPSSQIACTIGGNVAENSGGVHCLKYGLTLHNVRRVRAALITGELVEFGSDALDSPGYDLLALITGSEGLLAIITEVTVKLTPTPRQARCVMAAFDEVGKAGAAVAAVIGAGIVPAGFEMMDRLTISAVEPFVHAGYPSDAAAILLCESDGTPEEVSEEIAAVQRLMQDGGATRIEVSSGEAQRQKFWSGRKAAFPAAGRISPDYYCIDGTIPRRALGPVLQRIAELSQEFGLPCMNVFHA